MATKIYPQSSPSLRFGCFGDASFMSIGLSSFASIALEEDPVQQLLADVAISRLFERVKGKLVRRSPGTRVDLKTE